MAAYMVTAAGLELIEEVVVAYLNKESARERVAVRVEVDRLIEKMWKDRNDSTRIQS